MVKGGVQMSNIKIGDTVTYEGEKGEVKAVYDKSATVEIAGAIRIVPVSKVEVVDDAKT